MWAAAAVPWRLFRSACGGRRDGQFHSIHRCIFTPAGPMLAFGGLWTSSIGSSPTGSAFATAGAIPLLTASVMIDLPASAYSVFAARIELLDSGAGTTAASIWCRAFPPTVTSWRVSARVTPGVPE